MKTLKYSDKFKSPIIEIDKNTGKVDMYSLVFLNYNYVKIECSEYYKRINNILKWSGYVTGGYILYGKKIRNSGNMLIMINNCQEYEVSLRYIKKIDIYLEG